MPKCSNTGRSWIMLLLTVHTLLEKQGSGNRTDDPNHTKQVPSST